MQNFIPAYMKGLTYVRTIFSEPKFFGCIDYKIFLPMVLAARASRARELRYKDGHKMHYASGRTFLRNAS